MKFDQFAQIRVNELSVKDNKSPFYQLLEKITDGQFRLAIESAVNDRVWEMADVAYTQGFRDAMMSHEGTIVL